MEHDVLCIMTACDLDLLTWLLHSGCSRGSLEMMRVVSFMGYGRSAPHYGVVPALPLVRALRTYWSRVVHEWRCCGQYINFVKL
jgi:hypothetical protein